MLQAILYWWLDVSALRRWGVPGAILLTAVVVELASDRTWYFGWAAGVVLAAWVAAYDGLHRTGRTGERWE